MKRRLRNLALTHIHYKITDLDVGVNKFAEMYLFHLEMENFIFE